MKTPTAAAARLIASLPADIVQAAARIGRHIFETPLLESPYLTQLVKDDEGMGEVHLKLESEQVTGSFKARGSLNKILSINDTDSNSSMMLVTSSTGNHAQGFARAVQLMQKEGTDFQGLIFMPETAQAAKVEAIRKCYPLVQIEFFGNDCAQTEMHALNHAKENHCIYIPPYNDPDIIAGQGTVGLEIHNKLSDVDVVFVCIGGGGLMSGVASFLKAKNPSLQLVGCQPENSPEMYLSVQKGELVYLDEPRETLSDGSAGGIEPGSVTFEICQALVDKYVLVTEAEIASAIKWMVEKHHKIIEGAAAVALAAFQQTSHEYVGKKVAIVICGSNIGTETLQTILAGKI